MKNRPPEPGQGAPPAGVSVAMLSWFMYPGMGHFALGQRGRGKVWAVLFSLALVGALVPLLGALQAVYGSLTALEAVPTPNLWPAAVCGGGAFLVWFLAGLDAWRLSRRPRV